MIVLQNISALISLIIAEFFQYCIIMCIKKGKYLII